VEELLLTVDLAKNKPEKRDLEDFSATKVKHDLKYSTGTKEIALRN
jgi:hypothetical protein